MALDRINGTPFANDQTDKATIFQKIQGLMIFKAKRFS